MLFGSLSSTKRSCVVGRDRQAALFDRSELAVGAEQEFLLEILARTARGVLLTPDSDSELLQLLTPARASTRHSTKSDRACIGAGAMKIVVAYSGGLDTSVILKWIQENYAADVVAFCADIGQEEELEGLEEKALRTGASKCYVDDLREEFARDFIFPMFQASALYENQYFLGTSIARPLIAKRMVEIARAEKADAVAHGATGKGNDQVRFELTVAALAPEISR